MAHTRPGLSALEQESERRRAFKRAVPNNNADHLKTIKNNNNNNNKKNISPLEQIHISVLGVCHYKDGDNSFNVAQQADNLGQLQIHSVFTAERRKYVHTQRAHGRSWYWRPSPRNFIDSSKQSDIVNHILVHPGFFWIRLLYSKLQRSTFIGKK